MTRLLYVAKLGNRSGLNGPKRMLICCPLKVPSFQQSTCHLRLGQVGRRDYAIRPRLRFIPLGYALCKLPTSSSFSAPGEDPIAEHPKIQFCYASLNADRYHWVRCGELGANSIGRGANCAALFKKFIVQSQKQIYGRTRSFSPRYVWFSVIMGEITAQHLDNPLFVFEIMNKYGQ